MTSIRTRLTCTALGVALALLRFTNAQAQDCKLVELASLPMGSGPHGQITIPAAINGAAVHMVVGMGSSIGAVTSKAAESLQLKQHPIPESRQIYMSSGDHPKYFTTIGSLMIGSERATNTDFIVAPSPPDDDGSVAGLIGRDILKNFDLDFDFAGNKLNLFSLDHCEGKVVYWATAYTDAPMTVPPSGFIKVAMTLDGRDVDAILDTDSTVTSMTLSEAGAIFGLTAQSPGVLTTTEGSGAQQHPRYQYRFKTLTLSGIAVNNPLIDLVPDTIREQSRRDIEDAKTQGYQGTEGIHAPHLMVGLDVLRRLHLYIAYKEDKIYATAADAAPPAAASAPPAAPASH